MKTLVTGAGGFTASHLLPILKGEVLATRCDILHPDFISLVKDFVPDNVYHLAAVVRNRGGCKQNFRYALKVNVDGTRILLDTLLEYSPKAKILMIGSCDVYGFQNTIEPISENATFNPVNEYGITKVAQELLARLYCGKMNIIFTRTFNITGPGQSTEFVCSAFAHRFNECRQESTNKVKTGELDIVRDFLDVRDVANAYTIIMEKGTNCETYNVCSGEGVQLAKIVQMLKGITGMNPIIESSADHLRSIDPSYLIGNNQRLVKLGWSRKYTMHQTLVDLYRGIK